MLTAALHLTAATLLALALGPPSPLILALALLLSLLPDLDTPKSLVGSLLQPVSTTLERRFGHRTITHSLLALAMVAGVAYLLSPKHWVVLAAAYGSHLALDLLIGRQGIMLLWPGREWLTLTAWRDDGPASRMLLLALLPLLLLAALWPQLRPAISAPLNAVAAAANPLATPTLPPTARPSIRLRFSLPPHVSLSALRVRAGDTITEGQLLAIWPQVEVTPHPSATPPLIPTMPPTSMPPAWDGEAEREHDAAQTTLDALMLEQEATRSALLAAQRQEEADANMAVEAAQRALDALLLQQELEQQAAQLAIDQAAQALTDAQDAQALAEEPEEEQRALERVHAAEAALRKAELAQQRLTTEQDIARIQAEAELAMAQTWLDQLPDLHDQALATLDAQHQAAMLLASSRVERAHAQAEEQQRAFERAQQQLAVTATTQAQHHQAAIQATGEAHWMAVTATAVRPTPAPSQILSRASGTIVAITAEEQEGKLVVTLEVMP